MVRVSAVVTGTKIDSVTFGNALITDYLSQTDTTAQNIASDLTGAAAKTLSYPTLKIDTIAERTGASGIAVSHNVTGAAGKTLSFPTLKTDTIAQTDVGAAGIAISHDTTGAAGKFLAFPTLKADTIAEKTGASGIAVSHDMTGGAGKFLSFPTLKADTIAEKTGAGGIAVSHDMTFAAGKKAKVDYINLNPSATPAATEGNMYYDSTAHTAKLRTNTAWVNVPDCGYPHVELPVQYVTPGAPHPIQNTYYTVIDKTGDGVIGRMSFRVRTTGEDLQVKITKDGATWEMVTQSCTADAYYYLMWSTSVAGGLWALPAALGMIDMTQGGCWFAGANIKVEIRKTTAAGAGNIEANVFYAPITL